MCSKRVILSMLVMLTVVMTTPTNAADTETYIKSLVQGNSTFALDLYQNLRSIEGNIFFSPYSISSALAMTYAGARGNTEKQMAKVLHFSLDQEHFHPTFAALQAQLNNIQRKKNVQLNIANSLWGRKGSNFLPSFLQLTKKYYGAGFQECDFRGAPEESRQIINTWVKKQTKEKIKELIAKGVITGDTKLILANAIYFKGNWASRFEKKNTKTLPFKVSKEKIVYVPTMMQSAEFHYTANSDCQILEIPYVGDELSMVILLPKEINGLQELETKLSADTLEEWLSILRKTKVQVFLPKFMMTSTFLLKSILSDMGMHDAFGTADFSGIDGTKSLFINEVIHKAFVEVNEEGTEAAAATAVVIDESVPEPPAVFRADHPFVFFIRDKQSNNFLFIGRIADPSSK